MHKSLIPDTIRAPFAHYCHGAEISPGTKLVLVSGQLGMAKDGTIPPDCAGQARICFANITAILAEAGLGLQDVAQLRAFVTGREHLGPYMKVRDALFANHLPASTLMIVSGFSRPDFVVEVEVIAAGPAS